MTRLPRKAKTLNAVQSAPTIVTVADLKVMTVEAQVSEADISKLKPGMPVYFTLLGQPDVSVLPARFARSSDTCDRLTMSFSYYLFDA